LLDAGTRKALKRLHEMTLMTCGRDPVLLNLQFKCISLWVQTTARINEVRFKVEAAKEITYNFREELDKVRRENCHLPSLAKYRAKGLR